MPVPKAWNSLEQIARKWPVLMRVPVSLPTRKASSEKYPYPNLDNSQLVRDSYEASHI